MKNVMLPPAGSTNRLNIAGSGTNAKASSGDFNIAVERVLKELNNLSPAALSSRQIDAERLAQVIRFLESQMRFNESLFRIMRQMENREETDGQIKTGMDSASLYTLAAALKNGEAEGVAGTYRQLYGSNTRETSIESRLSGLERKIEERKRESVTPYPAIETNDHALVRRKTAGEEPVPVMEGDGGALRRKAEENRLEKENSFSVKANTGSPYADLIDHASETYGVDPDLIRAVIRAESGYRQGSTSSKGAMGLMQLMPETARELGVKDPYDPAENIMGGTRYLRSLLDRFGNNRNLALAAYNWGMGNVERNPGRMPQETRIYIARVNHYYRENKV